MSSSSRSLVPYRPKNRKVTRSQKAIIPYIPRNSLSTIPLNVAKVFATYQSPWTQNLVNYCGRYYPMIPLISGVNGATPASLVGFYSFVNTVQAQIGQFNKYYVRYVKWKVTISNAEAFPIYVNFLPVSSYFYATFATSNYPTDLSIQPGARTLYLNKVGQPNDQKQIGGSVFFPRLNAGVDTTTDQWQGNYNSSPTNKCLLYVDARPLDGTDSFSTGNGVVVKVSMEFGLIGLYPNITLIG